MKEDQDAIVPADSGIRSHMVESPAEPDLGDKTRARYTLATPDKYGVALHPDVENLLFDSTALAHAYGGSSFKDIFASSIVTICALTACVGGLLFGFDQGLMSIILVMPRFLADFPEVDSAVSSAAGFNKGLLTAMLELGAFVGAILCGFVADRYSRKASIGVGLIWFMIGSVLQTAANGYALLVVGRTIGGIGIGMLSSTAPVYVSEIAPPNIRGALLVIEEFMIVLGIVVMYYITYGTRVMPNEGCYRLPFGIQMVPGLFLAAALFVLPYSPRWLASRGRDQECLDTLCRLRRLPPTDPRVQAEWINIRVEACHNIEAITERHPVLTGQEGLKAELKREAYGWIDLFKPAVIRRTFIGIMLMVFQQFVGINALIYYSPTLFGTLGLDGELQLHMSGVMNVAQLVAVTASFFVFDKVGRKPLLIFGSIGMTISHAIVAIMIGVYGNDWAAHAAQGWVGVAFIIVFMLFFGLSWGPVPWGMPSEVHSSSYRAKGTALAVCANWLFNFIIGLITPPMIEGIGYGTFVFFAAFAFLSGIWAYFIAPETKGQTLEQMDQVFKSHTAAHDHAMKYQITRLAIGGGQTGGHSGEDKGRNLHVERV